MYAIRGAPRVTCWGGAVFDTAIAFHLFYGMVLMAPNSAWVLIMIILTVSLLWHTDLARGVKIASGTPEDT